MSFFSTPIFRKISPYVLFLKEVTAKRKPGSPFKMADVVKKYKQLSPVQRAALVARSKKYPNPSADKYRSFVKQLTKQLSSLPPAQRQREISRRWQEAKKRAAAPKGSPSGAATKLKKSSAHKTVRKAAAGASK